jgi:hypothetical protein
MSRQVPSIGRVVHYVNGARRHFAAIIVGIPTDEIDAARNDFLKQSGMVSLVVLSPNAIVHESAVHSEEDQHPGSWHFPEFVPPVEEENE